MQLLLGGGFPCPHGEQNRRETSQTLGWTGKEVCTVLEPETQVGYKSFQKMSQSVTVTGPLSPLYSTRSMKSSSGPHRLMGRGTIRCGFGGTGMVLLKEVCHCEGGL